MRKTIGMGSRLCLMVLIMASVTLMGCGGKQARTKSGVQATQVAQKVPEKRSPAKATQAPPTTSASEEKTELESTLDNLIKLAPLHITSSFVSKTGGQVDWSSRFEADLDAKGNQHITLYDQSGQKTELYIVDLKLYLKDESGEVVPLGDVPSGETFAFLGIYGGAYLLVFNNLKEARHLGSETVNGFSTDKYEFKIDLMSAGVPGAAAKIQGAEWDYKGLGWIEKQTKALVRAQVDWKTKSSGQEATESYHSEFEARKGMVTEIKVPPSATPASAKELEPTEEPEPTEESSE